MKNIKHHALIIFGIMVLLIISYGTWTIGKHINYAWQYKDMVRSTVREMVKPDALREKE